MNERQVPRSTRGVLYDRYGGESGDLAIAALRRRAPFENRSLD
jgi:hypothetical protein